MKLFNWFKPVNTEKVERVLDHSRKIINIYKINEKYGPIEGSRQWFDLGDYTIEEHEFTEGGILTTCYISDKHLESNKLSDEEISKYFHKKSDLKEFPIYRTFGKGKYIDNEDRRFIDLPRRVNSYTKDYYYLKEYVKSRAIPLNPILLSDDEVIENKYMYAWKEFTFISKYGESKLYKHIDEDCYLIDCKGELKIYNTSTSSDYRTFMKEINLLKLQL